MGALLTSLVFQPPDITYMHAKKNVIWLWTRSRRAQIPAFFIDRKSPLTILFSHGNAEDLGMIYEWFCDFSRELNVNILAYDYEGYGQAKGEPSESACYEDIDAAYAYLTEEKQYPSRNIIIYGRSLGSGPSCYLAERLSKENIPIGGLILQSPLLSVFRVAFDFRFTLPGDMFPNVDRVNKLHCKVLVVHGTRDEVVPFWNGQSLFFAVPVALREEPLWVRGGGHNNVENLSIEQGRFYDRFRHFFRACVPAYSEHEVYQSLRGRSVREMEYFC